MPSYSHLQCPLSYKIDISNVQRLQDGHKQWLATFIHVSNSKRRTRWTLQCLATFTSNAQCPTMLTSQDGH